MSEPYESSLQDSAFIQFLPARSRDAAGRQWESAPTELPMKRTFAAGAFLLFYLAAYLGVGFAGVTLIEHAWSALFR
jgi:hypothetical protein